MFTYELTRTNLRPGIIIRSTFILSLCIFVLRDFQLENSAAIIFNLFLIKLPRRLYRTDIGILQYVGLQNPDHVTKIPITSESSTVRPCLQLYLKKKKKSAANYRKNSLAESNSRKIICERIFLEPVQS